MCGEKTTWHVAFKVSHLSTGLNADSSDPENSFGRKMDAIAKLLEELPPDDQVLVFAPDEGTIGLLQDLFEHYGITYLTPGKEPEVEIKEFKTNPDVKVLILDLTSETAAGM